MPKKEKEIGCCNIPFFLKKNSPNSKKKLEKKFGNYFSYIRTLILVW
jgi:hypothetical protein